MDGWMETMDECLSICNDSYRETYSGIANVGIKHIRRELAGDQDAGDQQPVDVEAVDYKLRPHRRLGRRSVDLVHNRLLLVQDITVRVRCCQS